MTKQQPPRPTREMGDRIRRSREEHELSTQAAAAGAQISPGYLFKLENGYVGTPSPRVLERLAQVLDINYWELMGLAGYLVLGDAAPVRRAPAPEPEDLTTILGEIRDELRLIRKALAESGRESATTPSSHL